MILGALAVAILAGVIYEQIGRWQDWRRIPQVGRSVDIGGRSLNIYCSGEGSPAAIFDTVAGAPGLSWMLVQPDVAMFTRACWYDRAGLGWSDPGSFPWTTKSDAEDLHALLHAAGIPPPYVLVGASYGGMVVRLYNGLYPTDVASMVLVDAAHEDEPHRIPASIRARTPPRWLVLPLNLLVRFLTRIGVVRLVMHLTPLYPAPQGPQSEQRSLIEELTRQPKSRAAVWTIRSPDEVRSAGGLGDRPLIVLTAGKQLFYPRDPALAKDLADYHQVWMHELQPKLARLSTRGRQIIVENSGHGIQFEAPEAVVEAVREVVEEARKEAGR